MQGKIVAMGSVPISTVVIPAGTSTKVLAFFFCAGACGSRFFVLRRFLLVVSLRLRQTTPNQARAQPGSSACCLKGFLAGGLGAGQASRLTVVAIHLRDNRTEPRINSYLLLPSENCEI